MGLLCRCLSRGRYTLLGNRLPFVGLSLQHRCSIPGRLQLCFQRLQCLGIRVRRRLVALKTCLGHLQFLHQFGILRLDGFGLGRELLQPLDLLGGLGLFVLHRFLQVFNLCVLLFLSRMGALCCRCFGSLSREHLGCRLGTCSTCSTRIIRPAQGFLKATNLLSEQRLVLVVHINCFSC